VSTGVVTATGQARELHNDLIESGASSLTEHVESRLSKDASPGKKTGAVKRTFVELPCGLLICATTKNIDRDIFTSINDSGLVYDGRTVVDADFQTVDKRIFAVGPNTKFSRKYRFEHTLEAFNSRELGRVAAERLLSKIDPLSQPWTGFESESEIRVSTSPFATKLPKFSMPKHVAQSLELPGAIRYSRACRPGWNEESERFKVLETASPDAFCKLQVDRYGFVASISYAVNDAYALKEDTSGDFAEQKEAESKCAESLSQEEKRLAAKRKNRMAPLDQLVGIHVSYLNDLENQLACGEIGDLIEFLSRDWAAALYHDHFTNFCQMLKYDLVKAKDGDLLSVVQELQQEYSSPENQDLDILAIRDKLIGAGGKNLPGDSVRKIQGPLKTYFDLHDKIFEMFGVQGR
jgi:hypothetical protein